MSVKDTLVKMLPRRLVPDSETVSVGGLDYETSFIPVEPEAVYQDTGGVNPVSLSFSYADGITSFTASNAIDDDIFADYPLYYSTAQSRYLKDDPVSDTGPLVEWAPRLKTNPTFTQTATDQIEGTLATSSSAIKLVNTDYELNQFVSVYDNYKNSKVTMYAVIGSAIRRLGTGYVSQIRTGKTISFTLKAPNKVFDQSTTLGNVRKYYQLNRTDWPSIDPAEEGKPIMNTFGALSAVPGAIFDTNSNDTYFSAPNEVLKKGTYIGGGEYLLGVVKNPWVLDELVSVTEDSKVTINGTAMTIVDIPSQYMKYFFVGRQVEGEFDDAVTFASISGVFAVDYDNDQITINIQGIGRSVAEIHMPSAYVGSANNTGIAWTTIRANTGLRQLLYETTTNGQTLVKLDIIGSSDPLDEDIFTILSSKTPLDHSDFNQELIEAVGLTIDTAEFAAAQTEIDEQVQINIGQFNDIESTTTLLQNVVNSVNGVIYGNDQTNKYGYKIINENLSGVDWTVESKDILRPDLVPIQEYQDTASTITMSNPVVITGNYETGSSTTDRSSFAEVFNKESKVKHFNHYIQDTTTSITYKANNNNTPKIFYEFELKSDTFYEMQIGEIVKINNVDGRLINLASEVEVIILQIGKSASNVKVKGYEFQKVP